jgi:uncharacterized protein Veg
MNGPLGAAGQIGRATVAAGYRRLLERFAGHSAVLARFNRALVKHQPSLVTVRMRSGHRLTLDLRSRTEWLAYYTRRHDDTLIRVAERLLWRGGAVAVDLRADIGFWAVPLGRAVATTGGKVIATESVPGNRRRLEHNVRLNALFSTVHIVDAEPDGNRALDDVLRRLSVQQVDVIRADVADRRGGLLDWAEPVVARDRPVIFAKWDRAHHDRRRDQTGALAERLGTMDYVSIRAVTDGWLIGSDFSSPEPVDDLVCVGREHAASVAAALRRA